MNENALPKKKRWMIFRTESTFVYYAWTDDVPFPTVLSLPEDTNPEPYYWMGNPVKTGLPNQERDILQKAARSKVRVMTFPGRSGQRFIVEARGDIVEE